MHLLISCGHILESEVGRLYEFATFEGQKLAVLNQSHELFDGSLRLSQHNLVTKTVS